MTLANVRRDVRHLAVGTIALFSVPIYAEERDFCPERPGLDTPPCIVDAGHASLEVSAIDWTLDRQPGSRTDTILSGDTLVRVGLTSHLEAQIGWTAYGHVRTRTPSGVSKQSGTGDVLLGAKFNLLHPDGQGTSVALKPFVTLPSGGKAIGAGTWSAGLQIPFSLTVAKGVQLTATPEADAAANESGDGRHFAWGSAAGAQFALTGSTSLALEGQIICDDDPSGHTTTALGEASLAWQPGKNTQLDLGVVAVLNRNSPDVELIAGIARRF